MPNSPRRHLLLPIFKFGLIGCMVVLLSQMFFGFPFRKVQEFAPTALSLRSDGLFEAKHKNLKSYLAGAVHQRMDFTENAAPLGPRLPSSGQLRRASGAAWFAASTSIYFRVSDGSDPRANGRVYTAILPWVPPAWLCWMLIPAAVGVIELSLRIQRGIGLWKWIQELKQRGAFTIPKLAEGFLLVVIALVFLTPLSLTAWRSLGGTERAAQWPWISNLTLPDRVDDRPQTPLTAKNLWDGKWQQTTATTFNEDFAGREACVRVTSELWASVFRAPTVAVSKVRFLENDQLMELCYLEEYYLSRTTTERLRPLALKLKRFQEICEARKLPLVFLLTPSKLPYHTEHVPDGWKSKLRPGPLGIDLFKPLLTEYGIRHIDGVQLTREHSKRTSWPVFPRGGIHWSPDAAWQSSSAVIDQLRTSWPDLPVVAPPTVSALAVPTGEEWDMEQLLTLAKRWDSPVDSISITPPAEAATLPPRRLVAIGRSFTGKILEQLIQTRLIASTDWFFYYNQLKFRDDPIGRVVVRKPATPVDFENEIFSASAILLEANESIFDGSGPPHLNEFLDDALAFLNAKP